MHLRQPNTHFFPYTTLFRSACLVGEMVLTLIVPVARANAPVPPVTLPLVTTPVLGWKVNVPYRNPPLVSTVRFRSEEHTSELQSRRDLVCRLLLEKKNRLPRGRDDLLHLYPSAWLGRTLNNRIQRHGAG